MRVLLLLLAACSATPSGTLRDPKHGQDRPSRDSAEPRDTGDTDTRDSRPPKDSEPPEDTGWDRNADTDGDGMTDRDEGREEGRDTDLDGILDYADNDSDADGISDRDEGPIDTDGDGTIDALDEDSDADGMHDEDEGTDDWDGDGIANWVDAVNDGTLDPMKFVAISTDFNSPIGIDFHESAWDVVMSVNYSSGSPHAIETVASNGTHTQFSTLSGVTDEVKIATVRSGGIGGFTTGELFVGNGVDGQIVRIGADGSTVTNPWVDLPGDSNGLMRGSLYVDRTGLWGGDLVVATTGGEVWTVDSAGNPSMVADLPGIHLEGLCTVPDAPARFGPIAGTIIVGSENEGLLYSIAGDGTVTAYDVDVNVEDIDMIEPNENFFGVNFGTSSLLGVPAHYFAAAAGDILLTQEGVTNVGLFRLRWNGSALTAEELTKTSDSASVAQWEHVTFAGAGIQQVP